MPEFLTEPVDAASVRAVFARERPGLEVRSVRLLGGGRDVRLQALDAEGRLYDRRRWQSPWLVDVDDRFILKIPACHEAAAQMARARWALSHLEGLTSAPVPRLAFSASDPAVDAFHKLPGHELSTLRLRALPRSRQTEVARAIGRFLAEMHRLLPVSEALARGCDRPKSAMPAEQLGRRAARLLAGKEDRDTVMALADSLAAAERDPWPPVVLHDDAHGGNMLWDPVSQRLSGVLDFETVSVGDPHIDLSWWEFVDTELAACAASAYTETGGRLSPERGRLFAAVGDLTDAVWRSERGYPIEDGPLSARVQRIRQRLRT